MNFLSLGENTYTKQAKGKLREPWQKPTRARNEGVKEAGGKDFQCGGVVISVEGYRRLQRIGLRGHHQVGQSADPWRSWPERFSGAGEEGARLLGRKSNWKMRKWGL